MFCVHNVSTWFEQGAYEPPQREGALDQCAILSRITLQNAPYKDYNLNVLTSFEVTAVTTMNSQEPACCDDGHLLAS